MFWQTDPAGAIFLGRPIAEATNRAGKISAIHMVWLTTQVNACNELGNYTDIESILSRTIWVRGGSQGI